MDTAGQLLVDLQDLRHLAVLPVSGLRAGVLQRQAVLVDPLVRGRPVSTVCAPWCCGASAGNADSMVAPRCPLIRIM